MLNFLGKWAEKIAHEVETRFELVKLTVLERVSKLMSYFIFMLIGFFAVFIILILLGFSTAAAFTEITGSAATGYLIAAGIYLLLFCILFLFRKAIAKLFAGIIISLVTDDDND